jgi:TusA-related sulfurtransferase
MIIAAASLLLAGGVASAKNPSNEDMTGKKEHDMLNCPSAVPNAKTTVQDLKDGVVVTVVASESGARHEIQRRATRQQQVAMQSARGSMEHTGAGTGSGKFGYCPGMIQGTRVAVDELPDGARLTVRAASEPETESLQKMTRERVRELSSKR